MFKIKLGITTFFLTFIPIQFITIFLLGGMYRPKFDFISPAIYSSLSVLISLSLAFLATFIFLKLTNLEERLPEPKPATTILLVGSIVFLLPQFIKILGYMVFAGGIITAFMSLFAPFMVWFGKIILYVGIAKLLLAVEPHKSYVFSTYKPFSEIAKK